MNLVDYVLLGNLIKEKVHAQYCKNRRNYESLRNRLEDQMFTEYDTLGCTWVNVFYGKNELIKEDDINFEGFKATVKDKMDIKRAMQALKNLPSSNRGKSDKEF